MQIIGGDCINLGPLITEIGLNSNEQEALGIDQSIFYCKEFAIRAQP